MVLSKVPKVLFMTSVCPSVWGWEVVENSSLVPNFPHKVLQNGLRNLESLSLTMLLGNPWSFTTSLKKKFATWLASWNFLQGIKWAILENLSTTTNMESLPLLVLGSPKTKSIDKSIHGESGIGKGVSKPWGILPLTWPFCKQYNAHKISAHLSSC